MASMSTPGLESRPRARLSASSLLRRPSPAVARAAAVQDLLDPYLYDYATFSALVCDELRDPRSRPRVVEFGCGTGRLAVPVLATRGDVEYRGFERSTTRAALAMDNVAREGLGGRAQFIAPFSLDSRAIGEVLRGHRADFVILPRFLQTVPLCGTEGGSPHRLSFLAFCRQMVKPGGRIIVMEDVYGETADEHASLAFTARAMFRARLVTDLDRVRVGLRAADAALGARLARLPGDPALLEDLLRRVRRPDEHLLPLSAWQRMFEHLGFTYRTVRDESQKSLYFFTIRC